ncbi:MAG: hypothetical protein ACWGPN_17450 [Gammaproteobacteria bacterium]
MEAVDKQRRFTVVEIIVVVTMLAIVAAFAVPRLPASSIEARSVETTALGNSLRTNTAMAHALGRPSVIDFDGRRIEMNFGYPDMASIGRIVPGLEGFVYDDVDGVFSKTDDGQPIAGCGVVYAAPLSVGVAPGITIETTGC